jgi:hypothetical protein
MVKRSMKKRGKILRVRLGVNPNSSSLGSDVIFLMIGTPVVAVLLLTISTLLRTTRRRKPDAQAKEDPHLPV